MVYSIWQHRYLSIYYREPTVPNPSRYDHHTNHVVLRTLSPQPVSATALSTMPLVHASLLVSSPTVPAGNVYALQVFSKGRGGGVMVSG